MVGAAADANPRRDACRHESHGFEVVSVGTLQLVDSYYSRLWGPHKPAKPPKLPAARQRTGR